MTIDNSSIKRVTPEGGLESITLRSDIAARYILNQEALLGAFNLEKSSDPNDWSVGLKETLLDEKIADDTEYLKKWIAQLEEQTKNKPDTLLIEKQNAPVNANFKFLSEAIESLKQEYLSPDDAELIAKNNNILRSYSKRFGTSVYEVSGNKDGKNDDDDEDEDDDDGDVSKQGNDSSDNGDDDKHDYEGSVYYRLQGPMKIKGVTAERGTYS